MLTNPRMLTAGSRYRSPFRSSAAVASQPDPGWPSTSMLALEIVSEVIGRTEHDLAAVAKFVAGPRAAAGTAVVGSLVAVALLSQHGG